MRIEAGEPKGLRLGSERGEAPAVARAGRDITPALIDDRRGFLVTEAAVVNALVDMGR